MQGPPKNGPRVPMPPEWKAAPPNGPPYTAPPNGKHIPWKGPPPEWKAAPPTYKEPPVRHVMAKEPPVIVKQPPVMLTHLEVRELQTELAVLKIERDKAREVAMAACAQRDMEMLHAEAIKKEARRAYAEAMEALEVAERAVDDAKRHMRDGMGWLARS